MLKTSIIESNLSGIIRRLKETIAVRAVWLFYLDGNIGTTAWSQQLLESYSFIGSPKTGLDHSEKRKNKDKKVAAKRGSWEPEMEP
jgi:hypothetical protein